MLNILKVTLFMPPSLLMSSETKMNQVKNALIAALALKASPIGQWAGQGTEGKSRVEYSRAGKRRGEQSNVENWRVELWSVE
jgi:hypothetical protein